MQRPPLGRRASGAARRSDVETWPDAGSLAPLGSRARRSVVRRRGGRLAVRCMASGRVSPLVASAPHASTTNSPPRSRALRSAPRVVRRPPLGRRASGAARRSDVETWPDAGSPAPRGSRARQSAVESYAARWLVGGAAFWRQAASPRPWTVQLALLTPRLPISSLLDDQFLGRRGASPSSVGGDYFW